MAKQMLPLVAGPIPTTLTHAYQSGDTTLQVVSVGDIPDAINHVTIRDETSFVTVEYTSVSGNTLSGITYIEGDNSSHIFPIGSSVCRCFDKYDDDAFIENIESKQDKYLGTGYAGKILTVGDDGNITTGDAPNTAVWGNITGDITQQTDLEREFVKEYQGESNVNRPLVVDEEGNVVLGSRPVTPYVQNETCIFPRDTVYVEDHTVIF